MKTFVIAVSYLYILMTMIGTPVAFAQNDIEMSAQVQVVSDYRVRGASLSGNKPTIQGGFTVAKEGFLIGGWASSLDKDTMGADTELDIYGGYSIGLNDNMSLEFVASYLTFTDVKDYNYYEGSMTLGITTGPIDWALSTTYAPSQENLLSQDNLYLNLGAGFRPDNAPWGLSAGIGYEEGIFADIMAGGSKIDYAIEVSYFFNQFYVTAAIVGTDNSALKGTKTGLMTTFGAAF